MRRIASMSRAARPAFVVPLVAVLSLAAACSSGTARSVTTPATETPVLSPTAVPPEHTVAPADSTPVPAAVLAPALDACAASAPDTAPDAASTIESCLADRMIAVETYGVEGPLPIVLVEQMQAPCQYDSFIVSRDGGAWHARNVTALFTPGAAERLLGPQFLGDSDGQRAIETGEGAGLRLIDLVGISVCGSGPRTLPMIFGLTGGAWSIVWGPGDVSGAGTPAPGSMLELSDTGSRFSNANGDVVITGDAWEVAGDPLANVFFEAHVGPHRRVDQAWMRNGDSYAFVSSTTEPSAYATLVEFIGRLSAGDDNGAQQLLTRPGLIQTARGLGLAQDPVGAGWMLDLGAASYDPTTGPLRIEAQTDAQPGPPHAVIVVFQHRQDSWLIDSIAAAP